MQGLLEWQDFCQIRWHGEYDVLHIAETSFSCRLAHVALTIEGQQIEVDYLMDKGFMLQAKKISSMQLLAE